MTASDWLDSIALSSAFLPYGKVAAKYLVSHSASLSVGLAAFLVSKTMKGVATMTKLDWLDYVIAHPLIVPLWIMGFVYLFLKLSPEGLLGSFVVMLLFAFWLRQWLQSLTAILERQSAEPQLFVDSPPVKQAVNY